MLLRIAGGFAIVAAATAATILLNLTLLGYAEPRNDRVGKLSPRAVLTRAPAPPAPAPPPPRSNGHDHELDD